MSFKLPPFLIKKIFPPKKAVSTVDITSDGSVDAILIKALNVIQPFTIPENIDLGEFDIDDFDLSEYGELFLDDEPIDMSKGKINRSTIQERLKIYHKGESYTLNEILDGKAGGKTIAMGDSLTIILKLDLEDLERLTEGKHTLSIEAENIPTLEISFELNKGNMNLKFNSKNT